MRGRGREDVDLSTLKSAFAWHDTCCLRHCQTRQVRWRYCSSEPGSPIWWWVRMKWAGPGRAGQQEQEPASSNSCGGRSSCLPVSTSAVACQLFQRSTSQQVGSRLYWLIGCLYWDACFFVSMTSTTPTFWSDRAIGRADGEGILFVARPRDVIAWRTTTYLRYLGPR